jgi:hypothetical protein
VRTVLEYCDFLFSFRACFDSTRGASRYSESAMGIVPFQYYTNAFHHHESLRPESSRANSCSKNTGMELYVSSETMRQVSDSRRHFVQVGFENVEAFAAVDGKSVDTESLPLYTRYLMENGRHDHHQVSTAGMVIFPFSVNMSCPSTDRSVCRLDAISATLKHWSR